MNRTFRRLSVGLSCILVPVVGYGQKTPDSKSTSGRQTIERRAPIASDGSIRIAGAISSLKNIGWDRDSLAITGSAPAGTRFDGGVGSSSSGPSRGAKFYLETSNELFGGGDLELRVPRGARVWAKSGSATIEVTGVTGGLDLNVVGGSVVVSSRPRELNIEAMDGDVRVNAGADWLRVKTATGAIEVRGGSDDAGLSTVSGPIRVLDGRFERGKFETVTGDITYRGDVGFRGSVDLTTHSGRIELQLPPRPDLELDAATVTGSIENAVTSSRPITGREGRGMELGFSSGSGNTRVVVRSFKGNVTLKPR
jgi:hypothetical protein